MQAKHNGMDYWHYILVDKQKLPMFKIASKSDFISLPDYGTILYSGWGVEPPEDIKQKIKEYYGFDHDFHAQNDNALILKKLPITSTMQ